MERPRQRRGCDQRRHGDRRQQGVFRYPNFYRRCGVKWSRDHWHDNSAAATPADERVGRHPGCSPYLDPETLVIPTMATRMSPHAPPRMTGFTLIELMVTL